jgi:DNA primase
LVIRVSEGTDEKDSDGISPVRKFESGFRSIVDTHPPDKSRLMDAVIEYLVYRNFPIGTLPVGIHDDMLGRVVFPFYNAGILEYYTTRTYTSQYPKTTNPDVEDGWTGKSNVLWLFERLTFTSATYIVEGIFDCGSMWKIGKQAVPVLGKTISTRQMNLLKFAGVNTVVVMLDPDAERESKLMAVNLYDHGFNCHLVNWPMGFSDKDPNSVSLSELREVSENFTAVNRMKALELHFEC